MDRRAFISSLTAVASLPHVARAQAPPKVYRIGILGLREAQDVAGPTPQSPSTRALLRGLNELGYVYGKDFVTVSRGSAGRPERFLTLAAELIGLHVDVILAPGPALPALKQATSSIPVIMAATLDPVRQGFVQSLGHPGGNFTGFSLQSVEAVGKRLELLKELVPGAAPVAVLWEQSSIVAWQAVEVAARERGWKLLSTEIRDASEIEGAFTTATGARAGSLLVSGAGILFPNNRRVAELAAKNRLPAMYELREFVEAGGLISYGPDIKDIWRRAAIFVDKILKGAKPADLPVEQPTKFELVINLKAAKALGLTIPQILLMRADELTQ
jgi:putative tryptophan/tyrosine transport system substrate-binding protein